MKIKMTAIPGLLALAFVVGLTGCSSMLVPTRTQTVVLNFPPKIPVGDVIEHAIDIGRELKFPNASTIDKTSGLVDFGAFGHSMLGITAQARVKGEGLLEVTVTSWSNLVPIPVDETVAQFKTKWDAQFPATAGGK